MFCYTCPIDTIFYEIIFGVVTSRRLLYNNGKSVPKEEISHDTERIPQGSGHHQKDAAE